MRVGMIGLGKLGLPVATAIASRGLEVYGYDPHVKGYPAELDHEEGLAELVEDAGERVRFCASADEVVEACEVVFVAVQTPHQPEYEGVTPLPETRADFDYSFLRAAVTDVAEAAQSTGSETTIAVISTVLPGTMRREIEPLLNPYTALVYNPSFIAMGTTIRDFLDPEFVLLGGDEDGAVEAVYRAIFGFERPRHARMSIESAELTKVAYNTFIGLKLAYVNTLLEVCEKTEGTDVDEVTEALSLAHRRLISPAYLTAGMGDAGACHPRDNIALSWLARRLELGYDLFEAAMLQRERQAEWFAEWMCSLGRIYQLPLCILGIAYKPSSHLTAGSHPRLVKHLLERRGEVVRVHDPYVSGTQSLPDFPCVFLVGCRHPEFQTMRLPRGSVVLDPWRFLMPQEGVDVIPVGAGSRERPEAVEAAERPDKGWKSAAA